MTTPAPYSFENLTHSGLLRVNSKDDKNVSLSIDVFNGLTGFAVFTGAGGRPWKVNIPRKSIATLRVLLRRMRDNPAPCREAIMLNIFDMESKKFKQVGQLAFGIDENLNVIIDVAHNELTGRHIFPIRNDAKFDFSNTTLTEKESIQSILDYLLEIFSLDSVVAERLSSFKRQGGAPGGGGQRNFGGNNNRGGGGGGNYQNNQGGAPAKQSTFGGSDVQADDIHF